MWRGLSDKIFYRADNGMTKIGYISQLRLIASTMSAYSVHSVCCKSTYPCDCGTPN